MKYVYKSHTCYTGYGWIEPLMDSEDSLIGDYLRICEELNTLQAECEKLRKDAERYRWIRDGGWLLIGEDRGNGPEWPSAEAVDALVDREITKEIGVTPNDQDRGKV